MNLRVSKRSGKCANVWSLMKKEKQRRRCCMFLPLCAQGWLWMCLRSSWALSRKSGLLSDCSVDRERCSCSRLFTDTQSHCSLSVHIRESTKISSVNRSKSLFQHMSNKCNHTLKKSKHEITQTRICTHDLQFFNYSNPKVFLFIICNYIELSIFNV